MCPKLYHLVYQSTATLPLSELALEALLAQSRAWNVAHGLTGVLLYSTGEIMQVLEGTEAEVTYIFNRISWDLRHTQVTKLSDGPVAVRSFEQWSMGFKAVDAKHFKQLQGYIAPGQSGHFAPPGTGSDAELRSVLAAFFAEETSVF